MKLFTSTSTGGEVAHQYRREEVADDTDTRCIVQSCDSGAEKKGQREQ